MWFFFLKKKKNTSILLKFILFIICEYNLILFFNAVLCVFCICMCESRSFHLFTKGGGGVEGPGPPDSKKARTALFCYFCCFLVLTFNLFNSFTEGSDPRVRWFIFWKTIIFQGSRGGPTFYGVGGGVLLKILATRYQQACFNQSKSI